MSEKFEDFLKELFEAIKNEDVEFIKKVYGDWFDRSGVMPAEKKDDFFKMIFQDLKQIVGGELKKVDTIDDYCVAHLEQAGETGENIMTFQKKGDSWVFFNERTNFTLFKKIYSFNYYIQGEGTLRILVNGKRTPVITDMVESRTGFSSMINAALQPGENELTLQSLDDKELVVSIQISSGKQGEIMDSSQGDVVNWQGKVKDPVKVKFKAE